MCIGQLTYTYDLIPYNIVEQFMCSCKNTWISLYEQAFMFWLIVCTLSCIDFVSFKHIRGNYMT